MTYNAKQKGGSGLGFKVRIEIDPECNEEIIIKCKSLNEEALRLQSLISDTASDEIELSLGSDIHFVKISGILFFETDGTKTAAHTKNRMYFTDLKLYELEERLPRSFMRVSKSCIANTSAICSIKRELTGICEARFPDTPKKIYISRSYYKAFKEKIKETRLK